MNNPTLHTPGRKSTAGQSEILIAILFLGLLSGVVIAQNYTNTTMNITGDLLINLTPSNEITITQAKTIQVFANSRIELPTEGRFSTDDTLEITPQLFLDSGEPLSNQELQIYFDGILIGSKITDESGRTYQELELIGEKLGEHTITIYFQGEGFINPSSKEAKFNIITQEAEIPEPEVQPEEWVTVHATQSIENGRVEIVGTITPQNHPYEVTLLVVDAFNENAYNETIESIGEFSFSFDLEPGGYETYIRADSGEMDGSFFLNTFVRRGDFPPRSMLMEVSTPPAITYDPASDTIFVVGNGVDCIEENPCSMGNIFNEDIINSWNRTRKETNYFVVYSHVVIGDGYSDTVFHSQLEFIDIRKSWVINDRASFQMGSYSGNASGMGGWILSKVKEEHEGEQNTAFLAREGSTVKFLNSNFKVFEKLASNNLVIEDGSDFESDFLSVERDSNLNITEFIFPDNSRNTKLFSNEHVSTGEEINTTRLLIENEHEMPKDGENWTINFYTKGMDDLTITYLDDSWEDFEFSGLFCGDQEITAEIRGGVIVAESWECSEDARLVNKVIREGTHLLEFSFSQETATARNTDYEDICMWHENGQDFYVIINDAQSCCTESSPCTIQDICDSHSGRCASSKGANVDLYHPEDTNVWMFLNDLYVGGNDTVEVQPLGHHTWIESHNEVVCHLSG
jgi:hypothetical protein